MAPENFTRFVLVAKFGSGAKKYKISVTSEAVFHRPDYARALARQLLQPSLLDQNLSSGVFLSGIRRIGKTTFIRQDFVPALLDDGALVLYVDLWTDRSRPPMTLVQEARCVQRLPNSGNPRHGYL